jgi:phage anti-repressor protein
MENFINQFTTIPKKFIKDFYAIAKEDYSENEKVINFEVVCDWLNVKKEHLKRILVKNFEKEFDYTLEKISIKHKQDNKVSIRNKILLSSNCFKEICMISQSKKAKEVRKYFIEMEKLIIRYHETIKEEMYKKIGLLKINQKPKINTRGGVIYIIKALNTDETLYKIGKTKDLKNRLKTYNSGNANSIEPVFILKVDDIEGVENCIKNACKKFQYRKYKEVYEINLEVLKIAIIKCEDLSNSMSKEFSKMKKEELKIKIKNMKGEEKKHYIYVDKKLEKIREN